MLDSTGRKQMYVIIPNQPMQIAEQTIINWLTAHNFEKQAQPGANWWMLKDMMTGSKSFEYYIQQDKIIIYAYLKDINNPQNLEGFIGCLPKQQYINELNQLFNAIGTVEGSNQMPPQQMYQQQPQQMGYQPSYTNQQMYQQQPQQFYSDISEKNKRFGIIALICSIFMLIASFFGVVAGIILDIVIYWMASMGLKSDNKIPSIVAIILNTLAILICIINLILL